MCYKNKNYLYSIINNKSIIVETRNTMYQIEGPLNVITGDTKQYYVTPNDGANYSWQVDANASIISGQGSDQISVTFNATGETTITLNFTDSESKPILVYVIIIVDEG